MKLLVADDDAIWRRILQAIISKRGFETVVATNGAEAWKALQGDDAPQLAILDWMMPELDGIELCRMLRERERQPYTYLILLTAKAERADIVEGLRAGADDYLTKPFDPEELFARIRTGERVVDLQQKLRSANRANELLVNDAPFGIASFDSAGSIVRANPSFLRILGLPRLPGFDFDLRSAFVEPTEGQAMLDLVIGAIGFDSVEVQWKNADGANIQVRLLGRPMDSNDLDQRYFVVAEDVTERRQLETRMRESQRMEAIGRLAGGVAHDINNVLQAIMLPSEFLLAGETRPPARRKLQNIIDVAKRGASVAQQLLAFSRRQAVQAKVIDINEALREMRQMLRQLIREDVEIEICSAPVAGWVRIDPGQFVQIIINLVVNARDAMPEGGRVVISVDEQQVDAPPRPGRYVVVSVADTGCGIAPSIRDRIFEPFYTTKEFGSGTGLGLATVYGIVQQCGGAIDVATEQGRGSTFRILLPAVQNVESEGDAKAVLRGTEKVLLVEPDSDLRLKSQQILSAHGYEVVATSKGCLGLNLFNADTDLLVADMEACNEGGISLASRLRECSPTLRALITGAYPQTAIDRSLFGTGTAYLQKPFQADELLLAVRNLLETEFSGVPLPPSPPFSPKSCKQSTCC
jgi:PAS domain S-box-containing protein